MDIEIVGRHTLFFDDDATAAFVNSQDALVEWNSLLIDRYDVRHLLSSPPPSRRRRNPQTSHSSSADAEIDYERYLDLPQPSEDEEADARPEPTGGFNAVPFSYANNEESNDQKNAEAESEVPPFQPPFPVPESLVQNLPPTEKVHQIISRTALFVSKNGGQSEIVLRVKQGDNPTFGFLMPDHHLHPYFRFLVNHKHLLESNEQKTSNSGALSLLGSTYGEEDDDDDGGGTTNHASSSSSGKDNLATNTTMLPAGQHNPVSKQPLPVKKEASVTKAGRTSTSSVKNDELSSLVPVSAIRASSLPPIPKSEHMVLDPPAGMKQLVDKIVEFIIKNGRQFEGVLMEQDRGHGRFPFLIPSNIFHPYYLKVLKKAQESKLTVKSFHKDDEDFRGHHFNKKTSNSRDKENSSIESDDIPFDSDKKEKFKMVINKPKKESSDSESKPSQEQVSVQVDAAQAAAILQAATRGIKPPNLGFLNGKFGVQNEAESNEQKIKAERLKRAKMFVAMLKSGTGPTGPSKSQPPSRDVSVDPQEKKLNSENEHLEDEGQEKKIKSEKEHLEDDEKRAKRKYRDRSSIHHDHDHDDDGYDDDKQTKRKYRDRSRVHHDDDDDKQTKRKYRDRSSIHDDDDDDGYGYDDDKQTKRKSRDRSRVHDDDDEEDKKSHKKKYESRESEERYRKKHRHRSHDDVDKNEETDKKRKKKHRDEEEEERSRRKHKHRSHKLSSSHRHDKDRKSHSSRDKHKREDEKDADSEGHVSREPSMDQRPQSRPLETTEVPDELRAKIRAMLMSTM